MGVSMHKALQIAAVALLAGCVSVSGAGDEPEPRAPLSPEQIVAARQAAFHMSGAAMGNMKAAIDRGGDVSGQAYAARGVARWARVLPTMFPDETSAVTPTRARAAIWDDREDFNAKAAAYAAAADRRVQAAQANDRAAFAAAHSATAATCGDCHRLYQAPAS